MLQEGRPMPGSASDSESRQVELLGSWQQQVRTAKQRSFHTGALPTVNLQHGHLALTV